MTFWMRSQWGLILGLLASGVFLVAGLVVPAEQMRWRPLGIEGGFWILALEAIVVGLGMQLFLNRRAAARREANLLRTAAQLREVSQELDRLARTDVLTGVANRRSLFDLMGVEFRRSRRYGRELSVLMIDLDHFKQVNDRWGHPLGDDVLREMAYLILRDIRESDILGRYGGEEFAVILPEAGAEQAIIVGEKLRRAVEVHEFRLAAEPALNQPPVHLTISIGVASTPVEENQDEVELLSRADQALYEAKRTGRNRVVLYSKPAPSSPPVASVGQGDAEQ